MKYAFAHLPLCFIFLLTFSNYSFAQNSENTQSSELSEPSNLQLVEITLSNYIKGTSYNYIELIDSAFDENANLYLDKNEDEMRIIPIKEYISWYKKEDEGKFTGRVGKNLSIDIQGNIAIAKAEILVPEGNFRFIDMFLLRKIKGNWKIISKSAVKESLARNSDK